MEVFFSQVVGIEPADWEPSLEPEAAAVAVSTAAVASSWALALAAASALLLRVCCRASLGRRRKTAEFRAPLAARPVKLPL